MHIDVHVHAKEDLDRLWRGNRGAAAKVVAVLQEMQADPNLVEKLTRHGDSVVGAAHLNVKRWQKAKPVGSLWRFRILDSPATSHRVVYGYHYQTRQLCVLAVVHKDEFDYELNSDLSRRILADWSSL